MELLLADIGLCAFPQNYITQGVNFIEYKCFKKPNQRVWKTEDEKQTAIN